jgi:hypothetical protein
VKMFSHRGSGFESLSLRTQLYVQFRSGNYQQTHQQTGQHAG